MRIGVGILFKRATDDGKLVVESHVPLYKEYKVDLDSVEMVVKLYGIGTVRAEMIRTLDDDNNYVGSMPTELLNLMEIQ